MCVTERNLKWHNQVGAQHDTQILILNFQNKITPNLILKKYPQNPPPRYLREMIPDAESLHITEFFPSRAQLSVCQGLEVAVINNNDKLAAKI
jgi:hypothetical protein